MRRWLLAFFGSATVASLAGGIVHGFLNVPGRARVHRVFWPATLIAVGGTALSLVGAGAWLGLPARERRRLVGFAAVVFAGYCGLVFARPRFVYAITCYVPASLFFSIVLARRYRSHRERPALIGIASVVTALGGAVMQRRRIALHRHLFDHNATYHLVQAVSFALFARAARWLIGLSPSR
jgi:hypothetical protein